MSEPHHALSSAFAVQVNARAELRTGASMTPDEALDLLQKGNESFVAGRAEPLHRDRRRRLELARGQQPLAVLVGCSDSRVSPEILFGRGLGELFIVRVAGNTVDVTALGSIEYAVLMLAVRLIVVLGHERCGGVESAVKAVKEQVPFPREHRANDRADHSSGA